MQHKQSDFGRQMVIGEALFSNVFVSFGSLPFVNLVGVRNNLVVCVTRKQMVNVPFELKVSAAFK